MSKPIRVQSALRRDLVQELIVVVHEARNHGNPYETIWVYSTIDINRSVILETEDRDGGKKMDDRQAHEAAERHRRHLMELHVINTAKWEEKKTEKQS